MPARGSAMGAMWGSSGGQAGGGRGASPVTTIYGKGVSLPQGWQGPTGWLLVLVVTELVAMGLLRHGFRHYHGG